MYGTAFAAPERLPHCIEVRRLERVLRILDRKIAIQRFVLELDKQWVSDGDGQRLYRVDERPPEFVQLRRPRVGSELARPLLRLQLGEGDRCQRKRRDEQRAHGEGC